ncbi:hypothetical protein [Natrinema soli]|uniref:Uncharacterized protein n=1 Tax=Natrinema soli TaxID=1930624 RepID=A0ABD5SLP9_9EURY|nr:hypothetical protein [Natrinema soli]
MAVKIAVSTDNPPNARAPRGSGSRSLGDEWSIWVTHFSDGTMQAYAYRSRGVVDNDREEKTLEQERLYTDGDRVVFRRVHFHLEDVVDVLEEREIEG